MQLYVEFFGVKQACLIVLLRVYVTLTVLVGAQSKILGLCSVACIPMQAGLDVIDIQCLSASSRLACPQLVQPLELLACAHTPATWGLASYVVGVQGVDLGFGNDGSQLI